MAVAVLTFARVFTNIRVLEAAERTATGPSVELGVLGVQVLANAVAFNLVFWTTTLSTYKPWGNTTYGRRQMARQNDAGSGPNAFGPRKKG